MVVIYPLSGQLASSSCVYNNVLVDMAEPFTFVRRKPSHYNPHCMGRATLKLMLVLFMGFIIILVVFHVL